MPATKTPKGPKGVDNLVRFVDILHIHKHSLYSILPKSLGLCGWVKKRICLTDTYVSLQSILVPACVLVEFVPTYSTKHASSCW